MTGHGLSDALRMRESAGSRADRWIRLGKGRRMDQVRTAALTSHSHRTSGPPLQRAIQSAGRGKAHLNFVMKKEQTFFAVQLCSRIQSGPAQRVADL